jgi:DNA replication protein DnaC
VISKGYDVLYESAQNIISAFEADKFRSGYGPYEPTAEKYLTCDLLILDDLGTEFVNQFTVSCLYNLFNTRRNRGLSTIVSTNLSAEELSERYDDRIYSRIVGSDYTVLFFGGDDYRLFGDVR